MFRCDQARIHHDAAGLDREIMEAAAVLAPANFQDAQPASLGTVFRRELLEQENAVRETLYLGISGFARPVIEQEGRAIAPDEVLLQRENLSPIAQRSLREQPQLGEGIED